MPDSPRYRRALLPLVVVLAATTTGTTVAASAQAHNSAVRRVYVDPSATGVQLGTEKRPFRTLEAARAAVRSSTGDVDVVLENGTYQLDRTFALTTPDSAAPGHTITYRAAPGAHPVISGGSRVTGWKLADAARGIYSADLKGVSARQIYVDGVPQTRARGADNPGGFSKNATGYTLTDPSLASYRNPRDLEVVSRWGWKLMRCPVESITTTAMTIQQPCWHNANLQQGQEITNPTWIENAYELLDSPGEWYLDRTAGKLFLKPQPGVNLATATVTVPRVQNLVDLNGVRDVAFSGLTFAYSTWLDPSSPEGLIEGQAGFRIVGANNPDFDSTRAHWLKTPGAVNVGYSTGISFTGNRFTHLGAVGLDLDTGSQDTTIVGNVVTDVAATGIQIGGTDEVDHHPADARSITRNTRVANNVVTRVATNYGGSVGILSAYTDTTVIEHNKVYDLPYTGISVGWGWGLTDQGGNSNYMPGNLGVPVYTTPTTSRNTIVRNNVIRDIMKSQADGGAIYTLGANPGGQVTGNLIQKTPGPAYGAIYHDEGSRYWKTSGNALCDIAFQWLFLNHGVDIPVDRNFTTNPRFNTQANTSNSPIADNPTVPGCEQLPASIVRNAGLEPAYRGLDPDPPTRDVTAPSAPGRPVATAPFPTIADLTWPGSTDRVGVTGYSVFADGVLVSASRDPKARVTGLVPGKAYRFTVTARDATGNESRPGSAGTLTMPIANNLAKGKPVTASSFFDENYVPGRTVDGDLSTRWAQGAGLPDPSWIQVDLGARYHLSGVAITFEKATGYKYRVESSNDELTWTTIEDHTAQDTTEAANYSVPATPTAGRYVRLTITDTGFNGGSVYELEAYGTPASPNTDTQPPSVPMPSTRAPLPSVAEVSWPASTDNVGVSGYAVYEGGTRIALTTAASLRIDGLTPGSTHGYTVAARDAAGNESARSAPVTITLPADAEDLALGKAVTVSSYSDGNPPELAVDGDLSTRWAQGLGLPDPSWIQVDLGAVRRIDGAVVTFELPSGYRYRLEYSTDNTTWSTLQDHTATATTGRTNTAVLPATADARYMRLTVVGSNFNGGSIYELQVYGG